MMTLIVTGLCLYLYGWIRTLAVYVASVATIVTAILASVVGVGGAMLFGWEEEVRLFQTGEFLVTQFVQRDGFQLWEAYAVPVIAIADLFRVMVKFVVQVPNPISIVVMGGWLYIVYHIWWIALQFFKRNESKSTEVVVM